jgi:hypothetical protein
MYTGGCVKQSELFHGVGNQRFPEKGTLYGKQVGVIVMRIISVVLN